MSTNLLKSIAGNLLLLSLFPIWLKLSALYWPVKNSIFLVINAISDLNFSIFSWFVSPLYATSLAYSLISVCLSYKSSKSNFVIFVFNSFANNWILLFTSSNVILENPNLISFSKSVSFFWICLIKSRSSCDIFGLLFFKASNFILSNKVLTLCIIFVSEFSISFLTNDISAPFELLSETFIFSKLSIFLFKVLKLSFWVSFVSFKSFVIVFIISLLFSFCFFNISPKLFTLVISFLSLKISSSFVFCLFSWISNLLLHFASNVLTKTLVASILPFPLSLNKS